LLLLLLLDVATLTWRQHRFTVVLMRPDLRDRKEPEHIWRTGRSHRLRDERSSRSQCTPSVVAALQSAGQKPQHCCIICSMLFTSFICRR